jgi:indole-3-glycerol phosphate synthase
MISILHTIARKKLDELRLAKQTTPLEELKDRLLYFSPCYSLANKLRYAKTPQIIAEFKRRSPSKGIINMHSQVDVIGSGYELNGAAAISVLTDESFFGATKHDFPSVRKTVSVPIIRKEFIIDPYQIHESKAMGADVILLIAAILSPSQVNELAHLAQSLKMEVLLEIHDPAELDRISDHVSIMGVNNRNLNDFSVNLDQSAMMIKDLPDHLPSIAESGIHNPSDLLKLYRKGFAGFLMGEYFMRVRNPVSALKDFQYQINKLIDEAEN